MKMIKTLFLGLGIMLAMSTSIGFASEKGSGYDDHKGSKHEHKGSMKKHKRSMKSENFLKGSAPITATSSELKLSGTIGFTENQKGLKVWAMIAGLPEKGKYGIHIHENGSCKQKGNAAGGHFNPTKARHGFWPDDGAEESHVGDMGNLKANKNGRASFKVFMPELSLKDGRYDVAGKAVIIHAKEDDGGQPTGNAGARIGCGIIEVTD